MEILQMNEFVTACFEQFRPWPVKHAAIVIQEFRIQQLKRYSYSEE